MKKLLLFIALILSVSGCASDKTKSPIASVDRVVWAGLDYSHARFIGAGGFVNPAGIFPGMIYAWNNLVLAERLRFLEKDLGKPVVPDIAGVMAVNKSCNASQVISVPGPHDTIDQSLITPSIIAKAVRSYKLKSKSGVAVVFIVDRLVKLNKRGEGAVYVVAFDIGSRKVLSSERVVSKAAGFGFRNYWFRVIKNAERGLKRIR